MGWVGFSNGRVMYLKNLTVLGFKSFADKTSVNFQPGMTAIVGPNGCGKSNVSDALRWVLGEQSAKALRGGEMADVIFNGTDGRKPLGMAEVSLTIGDVDTEQLKSFGIPLDYNEVTITRRVFRDGGSEYFLNKASCRLRDIQALFAGTGMGKASYSIMAQGNITQILSSKPDDRRLVFEEAAGITKFKQQKREALRKLESTDQNLLRVQDLIKEVKRQIGSLQRQAGKARRYKALQSELQLLETQLARSQFDRLQLEIREREEQSEKLKLEMELCQEGVLRSEDEILQLRGEWGGLEEQISALQQQGLELKGQADRHEGRIGFNEERLNELGNQQARAQADITQALERRQVAEAELALVNERLAESEESVRMLRAALEEKRNAVLAVERQVSERQEQLRVAQSQAFSASQQLARARNEINAMDLQKQGNMVRLEKLQSERVQLEEEQSRLEARLAEFTAEFQTEQLNVQTCRGTLEERQARLRALQGEITGAGQELDGALRQQAEKRSRLNVLEQLDTQHEGFSQGALAALRQSADVLGSIADRLRVPPEHVVPVEAVLGHHLQVVLTRQPDAATRILGDLQSNKKGRASIAALELAAAAAAADDMPALDPAAPPVEGAVPALSVIESEGEIQALLRAWLGRTWIVPDLAAATVAHAAAGGRADFVTAQGDLLTRYGVYTGGSVGGSGKNASSILGRKNQIAELQQELAALAARVEEAGRKKGALQSEQTALQASLEQARTELRQHEVAVATRQGEFNALQNSRRSLRVKFESTVHDLENLTSHEAEGIEKRARLADTVAQSEATERESVERVAECSAAVEEFRQSRDTANAALSDAKVSLATEEQLQASHARQRMPLEQRLRELGQLAQRLEAELGTFDGRRAQFESEIEESRRQVERLRHERTTVSDQVTAKLEEKSALEADIHTREERLREHRGRLTQLQTRRGQLDVELAQKTMSVQAMRERIATKYQVQLEDIQPEGLRITAADDGGAAKVESVPLAEMEASGATTDWNLVTQQVQYLQKRLDEIGPVNLVAIEEYEETEGRHNFLNTQFEDLVKAKAELSDVINKINDETKTMFVETFDKIRANFIAMFTEIFGGGKADLRLVDGEDVLEAGIEIVARPPGKQLQSISLLSGGEQTMTAVALLFSIYQVKPSPFCVLDELDAPLDESNILRFVKVLQRFLEQSQFIVITHNKRTIAMADVLYGVTMQEQGVSRVVSVRFNKEEKPEPGQRVASIAESVSQKAGPVLDEARGEGEVSLAK
jgi:chromosome segregation protein